MGTLTASDHTLRESTQYQSFYVSQLRFYFLLWA